MNHKKLERRYYGVPEISVAYNVSDQSIYNLINSGVIECAKFGRRRLIPADQIPKLDAQFIKEVNN